MLKGKTAFITGSNRGIGKAIVEEFAKNGANIIAHARKETPEFVAFLKETAEKYGVDIRPAYFDMANYENIKLEFQALIKTQKIIHILVNNAGIFKESLVQMTLMDDVQKMFNINFLAPFYLMQLVSKLMVRQKEGSIINISSISALEGMEGQSVYGATKAALITVTKSLAKELGSFGIRANCIAPGVTETSLIRNMKPEVLCAEKSKVCLKRLGMPEDVAKVALFLASDESEYVTGQVIRVDGGRN